MFKDVNKQLYLNLSYYHEITDIRAENTHTLDLSYCDKITDIRALRNVHTLKLSYCDSGSGKTTLGTKLKDKFKNKIVIKDIDNLRVEFIKNFYGNKKWSVFDKDAYQKYT